MAQPPPGTDTDPPVDDAITQDDLLRLTAERLAERHLLRDADSRLIASAHERIRQSRNLLARTAPLVTTRSD